MGGRELIRASGRRVRRAFSLVELLIALAILGFGLLVIGAALPVGLSYTRESADIAAGQAAADYALELIEMNVRLSARAEGDSLVRPRQAAAAGAAPLLRDYEPRLKVRALHIDGVRETSSGSFEVHSSSTTNVSSEDLLRTWLGPSLGGPAEDASDLMRIGAPVPQRHVMSGLALLFPPIEPYRPILFPAALGSDYPAYNEERRPNPDEIERSFDRRIASTILYRRYSYDNFRAADNHANLYEFIVLVTRRPSADHRFPEQPHTAVLQRGSGVATPPNPFTTTAWSRTITPSPWLITFAELPFVPPFSAIAPDVTITPPDADGDRYFAQAPAAATLTFRIHPIHDGFLPKGSIFIPAVNDVRPGNREDGLYDPSSPTGLPNDFEPEAGFVPHAPMTLPIYEVVDRPDRTTVVVANNGFYPWTIGIDPATGGVPPDPTLWPVWVIPPAFKDVVEDVPVFERRSPVIWIERKIINLPEIP